MYFITAIHFLKLWGSLHTKGLAANAASFCHKNITWFYIILLHVSTPKNNHQTRMFISQFWTCVSRWISHNTQVKIQKKLKKFLQDQKTGPNKGKKLPKKGDINDIQIIKLDTFKTQKSCWKSSLRKQ